MHLVQVDGEWRISRPAAGAAADQLGVPHRLPAAGAVLPGPVGNRRGAGRPARRDRPDPGQPGQPAALAADPRAEQPAGRRGRHPSSPRKSALRSNPSVDSEGVLQVDLTGVDVSTPEARRALGRADRLDAVADVAADRDHRRRRAARPGAAGLHHQLGVLLRPRPAGRHRAGGVGPVLRHPGRRRSSACWTSSRSPARSGSGASVGDQRGAVLGDRRDRRGGRRPGRRPATADGPPAGDRPGRPGAEGRHPDPAELHPRRRRGLGGPERRDKA